MLKLVTQTSGMDITWQNLSLWKNSEELDGYMSVVQNVLTKYFQILFHFLVFQNNQQVFKAHGVFSKNMIISG